MDNDDTGSGNNDNRRMVRADRPETSGMKPAELAKFKCIRNAAYHEDWERFYGRWHRFLMFVVVSLGTIAFGSSLANEFGASEGGSLATERLATIGTGIAVLAGLIDVLWNVDGLARLHSDLRRRCYDLLARLEADESPKLIEADFVRLLAHEPPTMNAVNALAFNTAVDALGRPPGQKYVLQPWQRFLRHWWPFRPNEFPTEEAPT